MPRDPGGKRAIDVNEPLIQYLHYLHEILIAL